MIKIKSLGPAVSCTLDGGCRQSNVGEGYTELEYIENTSTAFIKTGIKPTIDTEMEFTGMGFSETSAQLMVAVTDTNNNFRIVKFGATSEIGGTLNTTGLPNSGVNGVSEFTAKINKEGVWVNGTKIGSFSDTTLNDVGEIEIFSGAYANARYYGVGKCKRAIIRQNGIDVFYGIPAKRNSDNKIGLYDKVTGRFIASFSSASFVAGSEVTSPTPSKPIDIVCNNGVIKYGQYSKNLFNKNDTENIRSWYVNNSTIQNASTNRTIVMRAKPNTTYYFKHCSVTGASRAFYTNVENWTIGSVCSSMVGTTSTNPNIVYSITTGADAKWIFFNFARGDQTPTVDEQSADFMVSVEKLTSGTAYEPYQFGIYTDGTQEVVTDSLGNTASAERLLALGDYKDTQEVLNGSVTRNIGIKALNGTENWNNLDGYFNILKTDIGSSSTVLSKKSLDILCTHYKVQAVTTGDLFINIGVNYVNFKDSTITSLAEWKTYLADQYAQGTPVIIVYPISSATTESVTPQVLVKTPVTQTAGSISNLGITTSASTGMVNINKIYLGNNLINRIE